VLLVVATVLQIGNVDFTEKQQPDGHDIVLATTVRETETTRQTDSQNALVVSSLLPCARSPSSLVLSGAAGDAVAADRLCAARLR
jgi:hypothetical protein